MTRIFRSTTAIVAILSVTAPALAPSFAAAQDAGAAPVVVLPPGADAEALEKALGEVAAAAAGTDEPVIVPPTPAKPEGAEQKPVKPKVAEDAPDKDKPAAPEAAEKKPPEEKAADTSAPVVVKPAAPKDAEKGKAAAEAKPVAPQKAEKPDDGKPGADRPAKDKPTKADAPVVVQPEQPKAAESKAPAAPKPVVPKPVAPGTAEAPAKATNTPAVVAPKPAAEVAPQPKAAQGTAPVVVAPVAPVGVQPSANAVTAATGQKAAPQAVKVTDSDAAALAAALEKAQAAAGGKAPAPVTPAKPAAQQPAAAAGGGAAPVVVAAPGESAAALAAAAAPVIAAEALNAPATLGSNASSVVVTDESARSSSEDFGTSVSAAAAIAAAALGGGASGGTQPVVVSPSGNGQPVVVAPGGTSPVVVGQPPQTAGRGDDNDNKDMLAKLLIAGLGAYAVGQMIQNQGQVALNTGDRVVVQAPDGSQQILRDDNALLLQPGANVTTENFTDGSSRSIVTRGDGSRVVTIRDAQLRVLRRTLIAADGTPTELINDATPVEPVVVSALPPAARPVVVAPTASESDLRRALQQEAAVSRRFSLSQVRNIAQVRSLVSPISIDTITFDTGSAAIRPDQAQQLSSLGQTITNMVRANPREVFMIEGYTDTVGQPATNLALSDRRAESLALALTEYFHVPPENMVVQGYGENFLKVNAEGDVRENRRVAVRRITDLIQN